MFINKLNSRINWKITLHFILLLKYSSIATEYQLNITTLNSRQQTKYAKNSLNTFINSLIQSYKIHHHHDHHHHDQSKLSLDVEQMNNSMKNTQSELKQLKNIDMNKNNDVNEAIMHGNHHLHEISYFKDNPRYANKTVCKSEYTWKDITIPWRILMKNFNSNCTHILGNLIISELDEAVVQHGIYFYDNPGLCYTPFTLKWDEMVESSDLQTIDLFALHSNANISLWYEYYSINEFTVDDISSTITQSSENIQNFHLVSQAQSDKSTIQTIDNEMDLWKANQVNNQETLIEHLVVENGDMPQLSSTNQNNMLSMPNKAAELNQLYTDNNNLASDLIYDETTISIMELLNENQTISEGMLRNFQYVPNHSKTQL
ncbi:Epidermal growth factor receptor [Schistosoma japonicum]|nr:Epidermal growth factor receptor [Schistosoma japonicum]KAH8848706.1 Epidermal growth factor receptor [Schistosoma japonicum]